MGWIADVLIAALSVCAVGLMFYKKVRQARGEAGCGCSGCSGCTDGGCDACAKHVMEQERGGHENG